MIFNQKEKLGLFIYPPIHSFFIFKIFLYNERDVMKAALKKREKTVVKPNNTYG